MKTSQTYQAIPSVTVFVPVNASERLPQLSGEFAVTMSHENDSPDEPYTQDFVEYILGEGWDTTKGWKIYEWLEQKQTADIPYIKDILADGADPLEQRRRIIDYLDNFDK